MATKNVKAKHSHVYEDERLAGGYGPRAAKQSEEAQLRRLVMANLLWEDIAYADGEAVADQIKKLAATLDPKFVADIAVEARSLQKLRHVPLLLCRELARRKPVPINLKSTLESVIRRPDELAEFLTLYWSDNKKEDGTPKKTLSAQVKKGLALAFQKFDEYQLGKWDKEGKTVSLRDVLFLCHAEPKKGQKREQGALWKRLINGKLKTPDTWEVGLSAAKSAEEKRAVWERLIVSGKLPAFAFLKNLRNMREAEVSRDVVCKGIENIKPDMLLPIDFLKAVKYAPEWQRELETLMLRCAGEYPKLPGWTVFVVDVSGSMATGLSGKSEFNRMDAAAAMTVLAAEMCEHVAIYATAGNDGMRTHKTERINPLRGFALSEAILKSANHLGGGGIFTRQCLEFIDKQEKERPDRVVVFSDSQDCDLPHQRKPNPFGKRNYIVDVSAHKHGVNYKGVWTAEISGWSEAFLKFIAAMESSGLQNA